jgi:hypothetical protein
MVGSITRIQSLLNITAASARFGSRLSLSYAWLTDSSDANGKQMRYFSLASLSPAVRSQNHKLLKLEFLKRTPKVPKK